MTTSRPGREAGPAGPGAVLTAMADPLRRQLLAALGARGPSTATELADGLPITRQAVAKRLAVLSRANLVTNAKHGRDVRFAVRADPCRRPPTGWVNWQRNGIPG
jgi:DNA-binding transcriptional ArsR family regulator